jgi:hypothetical protein
MSEAGNRRASSGRAMSDEKKETSARQQAAAVQKPKRPYEKPSFQRERVFETMALSCGKVSTTQGLCQFNRKNS